MKVKQNQKQVSIEEYIETYCQEKRVRERFAVYVSEKTHYRLKRISRMFASEHHTTTSSLADSILTSHFEAHRELLNDTQKKFDQEMLDWLKNRKWCVSKEPEESPDDVEIVKNGDEPAE